MKSFVVPIMLMCIVFAAISASGIWVYNTSASTFALQQHIRLAQNTRDRIVRVHLANMYDVQAFAATDSAVFHKKYIRHHHSYWLYSTQLKEQLPLLEQQVNMAPLQREEAIFAQWEQRVAYPIFNHRHQSTQYLLSVVDPELSNAFLAQDAKIQSDLDHAVSVAETHRKQLLERMIVSCLLLLVFALSGIVTLIYSRAQHERKRLEFEEQCRFVTMLQESLAPDLLPEAEGVTLEAVYFPAALKHSVGGDWYDVFELSGGRLMCIIGDVAGHGLDAAIVMNHARQRLAAAAIIAQDPAHVLQLANAHLHGNMVTVLCCVLDTTARNFTYASAGHPPPIIVAQHDQVQMLSYGGPPLGIFPAIDVHSQCCIIEKGSCVYLFTDGLIEHNRDVIQGEMYLLQQAALAASHEKPALSLYQSIIPSGEPRDDVAILSIKIT